MYKLLFSHSSKMIGCEVEPKLGGQADIQWLEGLYLANTSI